MLSALTGRLCRCVVCACSRQLTEEHIRLLQMQEDTDKEAKGKDKIQDLSVAESIYKLLVTVRDPASVCARLAARSSPVLPRV